MRRGGENLLPNREEPFLFTACYADIALLRYDLVSIDVVKYHITCLWVSKIIYINRGGAHATTSSSSLFGGNLCTPPPILRSIRPTHPT